MQIITEHISSTLQDSLKQPEQGFYFYWLGQSGFAFKILNTIILIDPYLSDSLAEKYKGTIFPHNRMMDAPLELNSLSGINWVACTHRHTDHMDPVTLKQIHIKNPLCKFLIPEAWEQRVKEFSIAEKSIVLINAGECFSIEETINIEAIPSAHEQIEMDDKKNHLYLGFILKTGIATIYHSGDCVPYPGLIENLGGKEIDAAFLPVNGRDIYRSRNGVPGNFTIDEAIDVCIQAEIPNLVCQHFGMFGFNTIDENTLYKKRQDNAHKLNIVIPAVNRQFQIV